MLEETQGNAQVFAIPPVATKRPNCHHLSHHYVSVTNALYSEVFYFGEFVLDCQVPLRQVGLMLVHY